MSAIESEIWAMMLTVIVTNIVISIIIVVETRTTKEEKYISTWLNQIDSSFNIDSFNSN